MKIGIDISQIVHEGTGVAAYARNLTRELIAKDAKNEYVLFGASLRKRRDFYEYFKTLGETKKRIRLVVVPIPPTVLDVLWNILHIIPVEWLIGKIDIFWSSDWTQPPLQKALGVTTVHDLTTMRFPSEMDARIVRTHARRLAWVKKECAIVFCDSKSTKKDIVQYLGISENKLQVVYPGI